MTTLYSLAKQWMRRRGDRVRIINGKYAGHLGIIESNVYQRTVDYPDEWNNGYQVWLDTEVQVTVRWEQVEQIDVRRAEQASAKNSITPGLFRTERISRHGSPKF